MVKNNFLKGRYVLFKKLEELRNRLTSIFPWPKRSDDQTDPATPALGVSKSPDSTLKRAKGARAKGKRSRRYTSSNQGKTIHGPEFLRMRSYVQFLTTPTSDTPGTALLLHFDDKRYIIGNIHEGLQRASLQIGAKFLRAKDFFITGQTEWRSTGGLMGMLLTLADAAGSRATAKAEAAKQKSERRQKREEKERLAPNKLSKKASSNSLKRASTSQATDSAEEDPTVTLHGGPNLTHTLATARSFIFRKGTPVKINEHKEEQTISSERDWEPNWKDNRIQVWAMPVSSEKDETTTIPMPVSPRKRNLADFIAGQHPNGAKALEERSHRGELENQTDNNQKIREFAVSEMFSSSWRSDRLHSMPLHQVAMPATIFVRDPQTKQVSRYEGPLPNGTTPVPNIDVLVRYPWPGALIDDLPPTKPSATAMSYIIRNHTQRGKFKPKVAKALNVPPGPLWSTLTAGVEVQSTDGKTITPDMVLEPSQEGLGLAIIDIPSKNYVQNLIKREEWKISKIMSGVKTVVWILGPGVSRDERLIKFMESNAHLEHIVSSSEDCPNYLAQTSAASAAICHHLIDPARYSIPTHSNAPLFESTPQPNGEESGSPLYLPAKRGLMVQLQPAFSITDTEVIPFLNTALTVQGVPQGVFRFADIAKRELTQATRKSEPTDQGLPNPDAEIVFLGTGSAMPSLHRNVSGTLLRVPGHGSYLLDCGENTLGQLKRIYTKEQLASLLQDLKLIWISHLHADHHLGLASVVRAWYEEVHAQNHTNQSRPSSSERSFDIASFLENEKLLFIAGNTNMMRWLREYSSVENLGYDRLVPLETFPASWATPDSSNIRWNRVDVGFNTSNNPDIKLAMHRATGLSNLVACTVSHCHGARAVSLSFPTGFKVSYSGDCRPSKDFAIIGQGSTVLIHEATFDDDMAGDAKAKKHSTTSEAIGVGRAMGARRLLLTHFSQRYQKIPSVSSLDNLNVRLEQATETDDPTEGMDQPPDAIPSASADGTTTDVPVESSSEQDESKTLKDAIAISQKPRTLSRGSMHPPYQNGINDMRIAVAFDYMRVKVGEIIDLEKFTPAMRELYKDEEYSEKRRKAAREAYSDNEAEALPSKDPILSSANAKDAEKEKYDQAEVVVEKEKDEQ